MHEAKGRRNRRELAPLTSVALAFTRHANVPYSLEIPDEDWAVGDEHRIGRLRLSLYGTRDAAQKWAAAHTKYLLSLSFEQGRASRCNYQHKGRDIRLTVHGDDFLVVADEEQLAWLDVKLRQQYGMKSEVLGPEANMKQEGSNTQPHTSMGKNGIEYQADGRHATKIMQECAVRNVRASKTPGTPGHADESCAISVWSSLTDQEKSKFRGVAARINNLAQDRADQQFAVKDLCRHMAPPEVHECGKAKRIARYMKGKPRAIQHFAFGKTARWFHRLGSGHLVVS